MLCRRRCRRRARRSERPKGAELVTADSARDALRRSFFDTALVADEPALLALEAMAGPGQILFGSDWPFADRLYVDAGDDPQPALRAALEPNQVRAVEHGNAEREIVS